jgi:signal transduction histidine kinase
MPNFGRDSSSALLAALGFAVFIRDDSGALRLYGKSPEWLHSIWPNLNAPDAQLPVEQASPFLENFLVDAAAAWTAGGENRAQSGPWVEQAADRTELTLEATALNAGDQKVLLLERPGEVFEAKKSMLQKARETAIAYQRLDSEMQKKEVLLSCIAEEMNAALANVITSLRLIEREKNPPKVRQLLTLASRATQEQQSLINKVLGVFATELEALFGRNGDTRAVAKVSDVLRLAEENVAPQFAEKAVRLIIAGSAAGESRVEMDAGHLSRVLVSLLENGLKNVSTAGEVQLDVVEEPESLLIQVSDNGAPLPPDLCRDLFSKSGSIGTEPQTSQLPLQFCRIAVENCHGEIGCQPRAEGGNCFWIRLPKVASVK